MNYGRNPALVERIAAEYALGTLRGRARLRFARFVRGDAAARRAVAEWEARLVPMAAAIAEVPPPARVWRAVRDRVCTRGRAGYWNSLAFWRGWGLAASAIAAVLVVAFALRQPEVPGAPAERIAAAPVTQMQASYVATIADKEGKVVVLAYAARHSDELWIKKANLKEVAPGRALELWGLPSGQGGAPRSLGLIPAAEKGVIRLASTADQALKDFTALAISLEPAGGSRTGAPTGPVLYSGPCFRFW